MKPGMARPSLQELAAGVRSGSTPATALVRESIDRTDQVQPQLNAFLHLDRAGALAAAERTARAIAAGIPAGPLAGIPFAAKDNLSTADMPTTCGSRILENYRPPFDATVISRLRAAGAILTGKTNLDEFAMGNTSSSSAFGPVGNPWDPGRIPGGSSGGSAAAVAAGCVPFAIGSDTGGSVRQPAALCGITGIKPTWGSVSRYGLATYSSSLDQIGVMARSASEIAELLGVMMGPDPRDATATAPAVTPMQLLSVDVSRLRVGWCPGHFRGSTAGQESLETVRSAIRQLADLTGGLEEAPLRFQEVLPAVYYIIAMSEASSNLSRYDGVRYTTRSERDGDGVDAMIVRTRGEGLGREVRRRVLMGTFALSAGSYDQFFAQASRVRRLIREDLLACLASVDVLALPTSPTEAGLRDSESDPVESYLGDQFTVSANLAGLPAISVPCGFTQSRLPVGLQLMAAPHREDVLLSLAARWQEVSDWHLRSPAP